MQGINQPFESAVSFSCAELQRPIEPDELINARAILSSAGHTPNSREREDFARYHRRQSEVLIADPTVTGEEIVQELFESLPEKLKAGLLPQIRAEVAAIHVQPELVFSQADAMSEKVNLRKPNPSRRYALQLANQIIEPTPTPYNRLVSGKIRRRAEAVTAYDNQVDNLIDVAGFPVRIFQATDSKFLKGAMTIPYIVAFGIAFPIATTSDIYRHIKIVGGFYRAARKRYPQLQVPKTSLKINGGNINQAQVTAEFAKEYLARTDSDSS